MPSDLERALSKLRFDNQVIGYSLMTKGGRPFVSFSFPDELFPRVKDSIMLYKADLRLMTIDTEKGLVVLSPVDDNWILTVLYVPELQLGLAIAKTKNVLRLLEGIELPPPPEEFEDSSESNIQVFESIAIKAASSEPEVPKPPSPEEVESISAEPTPIAEEPPKEEIEEMAPEAFEAYPSTIPEQGEMYSTALKLHSELYDEMKENYRNFAFDVLMLINGNNSVTEIADSMFQPIERISEMLKWAASRKIVILPVAEVKGEVKEEGIEAEGATAPTPSSGGFVKCPRFMGDISKIKGEDREVLQHCNGKNTTDEISEASGLSTAKVMSVLGRYRKEIKMIGKPI